jgi:hypothetical protein
MNKTKNIILVSIIVIFIIIIIGVIFYGAKLTKKPAPIVEEKKEIPLYEITTNTSTLTETKEKQETTKEEQKITEIDTSNWKTYRNEELGFEIKYPPDYKIVETEDSSSVYLSIDKKIISALCESYVIKGIEISINERDNTPDTCSKTDFECCCLCGEEVRKELEKEGFVDRMNINGITFYRRYYEDHSMGGSSEEEVAYQTFYNNKCYRIGLHKGYGHSFGFVDKCPPSLRESSEYQKTVHYDKEAEEKIHNIFIQILHSFRFLK